MKFCLLRNRYHAMSNAAYLAPLMRNPTMSTSRMQWEQPMNDLLHACKALPDDGRPAIAITGLQQTFRGRRNRLDVNPLPPAGATNTMLALPSLVVRICSAGRGCVERL